MKTVVAFILIIACFGTAALAQPAWSLKKDSEGIKVYTGNIPGSGIKAVKVTCTLNANLSQLTALLLDAKAHEKWVYNTKRSYLVKQISPNHLLYYSEVIMPWPLSNRDVIIDIEITQHPETGTMYVKANSAENHVQVNKDKVRVPLSTATWTVTPAGNNKLNVEYIAQADPGGDVPAWVANSFSTKGPFETFKKLKHLVTSPAYGNAAYAFIRN